MIGFPLSYRPSCRVEEGSRESPLSRGFFRVKRMWLTLFYRGHYVYMGAYYD